MYDRTPYWPTVPRMTYASGSEQDLRHGGPRRQLQRTEPDTDPGQAQSAAEVKGLVQQMKVVAAAQRTGLIDRRAGVAEKASLRREILTGPVNHLAQVGRRASRDVHELGQALQRKPSKGTYVEFLTASRTMQAAADQHKPVPNAAGWPLATATQIRPTLCATWSPRSRKATPSRSFAPIMRSRADSGGICGLRLAERVRPDPG
jgi:hypothetical protein